MSDRQYTWGAYRGARQHLFPTGECVQSLCGRAYRGEPGQEASPSKRKKCVRCQALQMPRLTQQFLAAAELIAAEQHGLTCLALSECGVPRPEIAAWRDFMGEPNSHDLWMKFGDVHSREAREHRVTALLVYAETL